MSRVFCATLKTAPLSVKVSIFLSWSRLRPVCSLVSDSLVSPGAGTRCQSNKSYKKSIFRHRHHTLTTHPTPLCLTLSTFKFTWVTCLCSKLFFWFCWFADCCHSEKTYYIQRCADQYEASVYDLEYLDIVPFYIELSTKERFKANKNAIELKNCLK